MKANDFEPWLEGAVAEVLESMCFLSTMGEASETGALSNWISSRLDFQGVCSGSFGLCAPHATAQMIATNFLGDDEATLTENQTAEVIGEVANMVCGALLARVESERAFTLTSPEPGIGCTEGMVGADRISHMLALDEGTLQVWLEIRTGL